MWNVIKEKVKEEEEKNYYRVLNININKLFIMVEVKCGGLSFLC